MQLCVQEENFKNYSNVLKNQGKIAGAVIDVEDMAERYIATKTIFITFEHYKICKIIFHLYSLISTLQSIR